MTKKIETIKEFKKFVKEHLDYMHEVRMGRAKDSDGNVIPHDDFFKGTNAAYVNVFNALRDLKE